MSLALRLARCWSAAALGSFLALAAQAQENEPILRLEAGGPTSYVTALAFSPDGKTLYAGSWDKTVHVWRLNARDQFQPDPGAFRVPIGPGTSGALNTIAVSPDGLWLAAAGRAVTRAGAGFRMPGMWLPSRGALPVAAQLDEGTIYVFQTMTREVRTLRGHRGDVRALAFAPGAPANRPLLVSAARERQEGAQQFTGMVRAWDVLAANPQIANQALPVPQTSIWQTWPRLALRRSGNNGNNPAAIEAAIAWGDTTFRVWDIAANRLASFAWPGSSQDTIVYDASADRFITSLVGQRGPRQEISVRQLRSWMRSPAGEWTADDARLVDLQQSSAAPPPGTTRGPRALTMISPVAGGQPVTLAAVSHLSTPQRADHRYELLVVQWSPQGAVSRAVPLWEVGPAPRLPQIAAAPGGQHVAISRGNEVHVLAVGELMAGRKQEQVLDSVGASLGSVAFVRQGTGQTARMGLRLMERSGAAGRPAGDLILDFQNRTLTPRTAQSPWVQEATPNTGWQTTLWRDPQGKLKLILWQNRREQSRIDLGGIQEDRVHVAVAGNARPPVIAVATDEEGLPSLALYDAASGRQLRQLSAHSGLIQSLAASSDGRLLASVADDHTVCVWRLTDLDRIVGRRGWADGIAVERRGAEVTVMSAPASAAANLAVGDVILGRVANATFAPVTSAREFYDAFLNATPNTTVTLRRQRGGRQQDVAVPVSQAVDESKPLFSLFVTRASAQGARDWIGWSPLGPYESSDARVERYLGWHFNPPADRPDLPATFADIREYRERYHQPGLLDALIRTGQITAKKIEPVNRPQMLLTVNADPADPLDDSLLREPPRSVSLIISDVKPSDIASAQLELAGQVVAAERQADGATWLAAFDPAAIRPGALVVKARVRTAEATPQEFTADKRLRYQPLPRIILKSSRGGPLGLSVTQPQFTLEATVEPTQPWQTVEVTLAKRHGQQRQTLEQWSTDRPLEIKQTIELSPGSNTIELIAKNRDALSGFEAWETVEQRLPVNFTSEFEFFKSVVITVPDVGGSRVVNPADELLPIRASEVEIKGELPGITEPTIVEASIGESKVEIPVIPAANGKATLAGKVPVPNDVGPLVLRRKVAGAPAVDTAVRIDNRVPLPTVVVQQPEDGRTLVAGRDEPAVDLVALLEGAPLDRTLRAVVLRSGSPLSDPPTLDRETRTLRARVPLEPGENSLEIRLSDDHNTPATTTVATVKYLRLPTVATLVPQAAAPQAAEVEVAVAGQSATPLTQLTANGDLVPTAAIRYDAATGQWQATVRALRRAEPYDLSVQAWNSDGQSLAPGVWRVPARPQTAAARPTIAVPAEANVSQPDYVLEFTVRSPSPLRTLTVKQERATLPIALGNVTPDIDGSYVYALKFPTRLAKGTNRFEINAANDGAVATEATTISFTEQPARIFFDLVEFAQPGSTVTQKLKAAGDRVAETVPVGKVWIHGHVQWLSAADPGRAKTPQRVQVWVNGFQQFPAYTIPLAGDSSRSGIKAFVLLNQNKNTIELKLPDVPSDAASSLELSVDCNKPIRGQRLHLLAIGVGVAEAKKPQFEEEIANAFEAKVKDRARKKYWTTAFEDVQVYGPLVGDVDPPAVHYQLKRIKGQIDRLYRANEGDDNPQNDVVMIYLQGGTIVHVDPHFFVTTAVPTNTTLIAALKGPDLKLLPSVAVHSQTLADFLTSTSGAHVLMLDVTGNQATDQNARWPSDSRAAMLRYTWLKGPGVPSEARLLAALPESITSPGTLSRLNSGVAEFVNRLALDIREGIGYTYQAPETMQTLQLGKP